MPIFTLPADFASTTLDIMGNLLEGFSPLLTLVFGVSLSVIAVAVLVSVLLKHH